MRLIHGVAVLALLTTSSVLHAQADAVSLPLIESVIPQG